MAEITTAPTDLPSTNALDNHTVDTGEREIRLGSNVLLILDNPPNLGETRDIVLRMRCVRRAADQLNTDGDITHFCGMKIVTAWELGSPKPPDPNENQGSLLDIDGNVTDDEGESS